MIRETQTIEERFSSCTTCPSCRACVRPVASATRGACVTRMKDSYSSLRISVRPVMPGRSAATQESSDGRGSGSRTDRAGRELCLIIVGYTLGGVPYGITWEEWEAMDDEDDEAI